MLELNNQMLRRCQLVSIPQPLPTIRTSNKAEGTHMNTGEKKIVYLMHSQWWYSKQHHGNPMAVTNLMHYIVHHISHIVPTQCIGVEVITVYALTVWLHQQLPDIILCQLTSLPTCVRKTAYVSCIRKKTDVKFSCENTINSLQFNTSNWMI